MFFDEGENIFKTCTPVPAKRPACGALTRQNYHGVIGSLNRDLQKMILATTGTKATGRACDVSVGQWRARIRVHGSPTLPH